jgi:hypothetical protein
MCLYRSCGENSRHEPAHDAQNRFVSNFHTISKTLLSIEGESLGPACALDLHAMLASLLRSGAASTLLFEACEMSDGC